jgi:hypothetical protein
MADVVFFDEKEMLNLGWPLHIIEALRRVFESDAESLQAEIDNNSLLITGLQDDKANKIASAVTGNIISQLADGDIQDSGVAASQVTTNATDIGTLSTVVSNKVDKVGSATLDNVATLLANGNIQDSGQKLSDYVIIIGTGSPESAVTANQSKLYIDDAVPTQYFNPVPGNNTGWVAL